MGYVPMPLLTPEQFEEAMDKVPAEVPRSEAARLIARQGAKVNRADQNSLLVVAGLALLWLGGVVMTCLVLRYL